MVQLKFIVGANRHITTAEYKLFLEYLEPKIISKEILRYSATLEKGSKSDSKYHIQCVFEFNDTLFVKRDWSRKLKEKLKFNSVLMNSRKSCCFQRLGTGQEFLLIACGYNMKDDNKKKTSSYGISDDEFQEYGARYDKLCKKKDDKSKMLFIGNVLRKSVAYAKEHKLRTFPSTLLAMYNDGYEITNILRKLPMDLETLFNDKLSDTEMDMDNFMDLLWRPD